MSEVIRAVTRFGADVGEEPWTCRELRLDTCMQIFPCSSRTHVRTLAHVPAAVASIHDATCRLMPVRMAPDWHLVEDFPMHLCMHACVVVMWGHKWSFGVTNQYFVFTWGQHVHHHHVHMGPQTSTSCPLAVLPGRCMCCPDHLIPASPASSSRPACAHAFKWRYSVPYLLARPTTSAAWRKSMDTLALFPHPAPADMPHTCAPLLSCQD